jgi:hypothetical protein
MSVLEAVLALIGLAFLILLAIGLLNGRTPAPQPEDDLAAPYREALHAALRMQVAAQELRQQLYAEAIQQSRTTYTHAHGGGGSGDVGLR